MSRIWSDREFTALDARPQQIFMLLISYPTRNYAGVLPLTLRRWSNATADATPDNVKAALHVLAETKFILVDWNTEEVLIRTFIRNDEVYRQPNVMKSAMKDVLKVESQLLRAALRDELMKLPPHNNDENTKVTAKGLVETLPEPFPNPSETLPASPKGTPVETPSDGLPLGCGVGSYVSGVQDSPSTENPSPSPAPPPSGVAGGGQLEVLDAELVPVEDDAASKEPKPTYLSDDWTPSQRTRDDLKAKYPNLKLGVILEEFVNHWTSLPKVAKNRRTNWDKTFRNRVAQVSDQRRLQRTATRPGADTKIGGWDEVVKGMSNGNS